MKPAMIDPLDEFSLYMLFHQAERVVPEEEYNWDPELIWQNLVILDPNPLQGYAIPDYLQHYVEDDLVQEEPRVLGDHISTFNSVFDSVCDVDHDPCSYITDGGLPRPQIPYPNNKDCSIMVTDLVPLANLWDIDEVVDIQVGTEVWAVNRSLTEDLAEDLGLDTEVPKSTTATDKGKRKLGEVPADLWDVNEDPQAEPFINPETGELLPGFEAFVDDTWSSTDEEPEKAEFKRKLTQPKLKTN
ncbi:hypothetical protein RHMOL_Rhmol04G0252000 [Rhododendron molle]|uniref:Uncharacterized protein n=1 Tax=Rhododendron molle TaxID=49168 RepID=A0ACC0P408_RHOML|nr:hypothetical protein RHMOL_Rhmol04G0252000 [Rhododendron molle]